MGPNTFWQHTHNATSLHEGSIPLPSFVFRTSWGEWEGDHEKTLGIIGAIVVSIWAAWLERGFSICVC